MYQGQSPQNSANWDIADGLTVYASDGTKLGTVRNYSPTAGYLDVRQGWLFSRDFYVPFAAIESVTEDGVTLNLTQDALDDDRYSDPGLSDYVGTRSVDGTTQVAGTTVVNTGIRQSDDTDIRVPVREEELVAGKRTEEEGRIRVHKDVVEEQQTIDVPLSHERVTVERIPSNGGKVSTDDAFVERDIDVPLMGEAAVVEKQVRGVEEVRIHKEVVQDDQQVTDTVRKERVSVDGANENGQVASVDASTQTRSVADDTFDDGEAIKNRFSDR